MINQIGVSTATPLIKNISQESTSAVTDVTKGFSSYLTDAIEKLDTQESHVNALNTDFIANKPVDVHTLMIEAQRAELGLQLTVQVRNKAVEAYQEIMRTQI